MVSNIDLSLHESIPTVRGERDICLKFKELHGEYLYSNGEFYVC